MHYSGPQSHSGIDNYPDKPDHPARHGHRSGAADWPDIQFPQPAPGTGDGCWHRSQGHREYRGYLFWPLGQSQYGHCLCPLPTVALARTVRENHCALARHQRPAVHGPQLPHQGPAQWYPEGYKYSYGLSCRSAQISHQIIKPLGIHTGMDIIINTYRG